MHGKWHDTRYCGVFVVYFLFCNTSDIHAQLAYTSRILYKSNVTAVVEMEQRLLAMQNEYVQYESCILFP